MTSPERPVSKDTFRASADIGSGAQPVAPRVGQAIYWNTLFMPITYGLGFGLSIVIVWLLGLELYAVYALVLSFVNVASWFMNLGIPQALGRFVPELDQPESQEHVLFFLKRVWLVGGMLLLSMIVLLNAKPEAVLRLFHLESYGSWMVIGVSVILIFKVGSLSLESLLKAFFQHRATNVVQVLYGLIRPACVVIALLLSRDFRGVLVALVIAEAAYMGMMAFSLWRYPGVRRWKASRPPFPGLWGRFVRYAATAHTIRFLRSCVQADVVILLLALVVEKPELALIAFAYNLLNRFIVIIQRPVLDVIQPYFNISAANLKGRDVPRQAANLLSKGSVLVFVFVGVGLLCFTSRLISLLFPLEFSPAVTLLMILIAFFFASKLFSLPAAFMLMAYERNKQMILAKIILLLNLPLMFLAYGALGVVGPVLSAGLVRMATSLMIYLKARKEFSWSLPWSFLIKAVACAFFWGAVVAWGLVWAGTGWVPTIVMALIAGALLLLCLTGPRWFTTAERQLLLSLEIPGTEWALRFLRFEPVGSAS